MCRGRHLRVFCGRGLGCERIANFVSDGRDAVIISGLRRFLFFKNLYCDKIYFDKKPNHRYNLNKDQDVGRTAVGDGGSLGVLFVWQGRYSVSLTAGSGL